MPVKTHFPLSRMGGRAGRARRQATSQRQAGVGLVEVLVAVLVLSIGFLGIAALQAMSLSTNNSSMARNMATISTFSIMDAMRADKTQAEALAYNGTVTGDACPTDTSTLAGSQLATWCAQLSSQLGAVKTTSGTITCDGTGNCTVTVQFDDSRAGLGGTNAQQITTTGML